METTKLPEVSSVPGAPQVAHNVVAEQPYAQPSMESSMAYSNTTTITPPPEVAKNASYNAAAPAPGQYAGPNVRYPQPVPLNSLREQAAWVVCPFCNVQSLTTVESEPSTLTQYVLRFPLCTLPHG
jgi:hypothetical protein